MMDYDEKLRRFNGLFREMLNYCWRYADELQWSYYNDFEANLKYYRTKIEGLQVIVGFNLENSQYFLAMGKLGEIGAEDHRMLFPTKLQRMFSVLHQFEKRVYNDHEDDNEPVTRED